MRIKFQCCSDVGKCCDTLGSVKLATLRPIINQNNTQQRDASVNTKCQHHKAIKVSTTSNVLTEDEAKLSAPATELSADVCLARLPRPGAASTLSDCSSGNVLED